MVELPNEFSSKWCKYKETVNEVAGRKETSPELSRHHALNLQNDLQ